MNNTLAMAFGRLVSLQ